MPGTEHVESREPNHPLAFRMGGIAFLNRNITIACRGCACCSACRSCRRW